MEEEIKLKYFTIINIEEKYDIGWEFVDTYTGSKVVTLTELEMSLRSNDYEYTTIDIKPKEPGDYGSYGALDGRTLSYDMLCYIIQLLTTNEQPTLSEFIEAIKNKFKYFDIIID